MVSAEPPFAQEPGQPGAGYEERRAGSILGAQRLMGRVAPPLPPPEESTADADADVGEEMVDLSKTASELLPGEVERILRCTGKVDLTFKRGLLTLKGCVAPEAPRRPRWEACVMGRAGVVQCAAGHALRWHWESRADTVRWHRGFREIEDRS